VLNILGGGDSDLLDPLHTELNGGLKYIARLDDGTWTQMLTPGEWGYGLMVWQMAKNCGACGDSVESWLTPALCMWRSIIDPSTNLADTTVLERFHEPCYSERWSASDLRGPMVGIRTLWTPELTDLCIHYSYTTYRNLDTGDEDYCDGECVPLDTGVGDLIGMTAVMNLVPIDDTIFAMWLPQLSKKWRLHSDIYSNYSYCACMIDGVEDDECMVTQWDKEYGSIGWQNQELLSSRWLAESNCECSTHNFVRYWDEFTHMAPDYVDEMNDDLFEATWAYALDRYFTGWKWLEQNTPDFTNITGRNAWLTSFSRRFSPYSGPSGLAEYLQTHALQQYAA
jgi:hypothetical protein